MKKNIKPILIVVLVIFMTILSNGCGVSKESQKVRLVDKTTGVGFYQTGYMKMPRTMHTATLLQDGRVLITGGTVFPEEAGRLSLKNIKTPFNSTEIYDPTTGKFTQGPDMIGHRSDHSAIMLPDGRVFIAGGNNLDKHDAILGQKTTEIYDPKTNKFYAGPEMSTRRCAVITLLLNDGRVLIRGIEGVSGETSMDIYNPKTNTIDKSISPSFFINNMQVLPNGKVLQILCQSNISYIYDPTTDAVIKGSGMNIARQCYVSMKLEDGRILVAGGQISPYYYNSKTYTAEVYESKLNKYVMLESQLERNNMNQCAVLLKNGHVLIWGDGSGSRNSLLEEFDPKTNKFYTNYIYTPISTSSAVMLIDGSILFSGGVNRGFDRNIVTNKAYVYKY